MADPVAIGLAALSGALGYVTARDRVRAQARAAGFAAAGERQKLDEKIRTQYVSEGELGALPCEPTIPQLERTRSRALVEIQGLRVRPRETDQLWNLLLMRAAGYAGLGAMSITMDKTPEDRAWTLYEEPDTILDLNSALGKDCTFPSAAGIKIRNSSGVVIGWQWINQTSLWEPLGACMPVRDDGSDVLFFYHPTTRKRFGIYVSPTGRAHLIRSAALDLGNADLGSDWRNIVLDNWRTVPIQNPSALVGALPWWQG